MMNFDDIKNFILPFMPTVLTIAGWLIVFWREKKKSINDRRNKRIDSAIEMVSYLEQKGREYYQLPVNKGKDLELDIKFTFRKLSMSCSKISPSLDPTVNDLKKSITGGNFESHSRKILDKDHKLLYEIQQNAEYLFQKLDDEYDK